MLHPSYDDMVIFSGGERPPRWGWGGWCCPSSSVESRWWWGESTSEQQSTSSWSPSQEKNQKVWHLIIIWDLCCCQDCCGGECDVMLKESERYIWSWACNSGWQSFPNLSIIMWSDSAKTHTRLSYSNIPGVQCLRQLRRIRIALLLLWSPRPENPQSIFRVLALFTILLLFRKVSIAENLNCDYSDCEYSEVSSFKAFIFSPLSSWYKKILSTKHNTDLSTEPKPKLCKIHWSECSGN